MARPKVYDDELRARLIRTAATAIADGGAEAVVLREVAAAEDTSTNAIYTMFGSRSGLVDAVVEEARVSFSTAQADALAQATPIDGLLALGYAYRTWALANPALYTVLMGGRVAGHGTLADAHWTDDVTVQPLLTAVRQVEAEHPVGDDRTPEDVASMLWAGVHGMVSIEIALWGARPREERDRVFDDLLVSLGARWPAPES